MIDPTDYTNGQGTERHPNQQVLDEAADRARHQGLTQVHSAILTEPMTFRLLAEDPKGAIPLKQEYWIEYRGR